MYVCPGCLACCRHTRQFRPGPALPRITAWSCAPVKGLYRKRTRRSDQRFARGINCHGEHQVDQSGRHRLVSQLGASLKPSNLRRHTLVSGLRSASRRASNTVRPIHMPWGFGNPFQSHILCAGGPGPCSAAKQNRTRASGQQLSGNH